MNTYEDDKRWKKLSDEVDALWDDWQECHADPESKRTGWRSLIDILDHIDDKSLEDLRIKASNFRKTLRARIDEGRQAHNDMMRDELGADWEHREERIDAWQAGD